MLEGLAYHEGKRIITTWVVSSERYFREEGKCIITTLGILRKSKVIVL